MLKNQEKIEKMACIFLETMLYCKTNFCECVLFLCAKSRVLPP